MVAVSLGLIISTYSYFEKGCRQKCAHDVGYDQYTVPDTVAVKTSLVLLSYSTRKHMSMASCALLSNFFEEQRTQNHPQYRIRDCRVHFFRQPFSK